MSDKYIYRVSNDISFRQCSLAKDDQTEYGDCTNFFDRERNWTTYFECSQIGIHFHCTKHINLEMEMTSDRYTTSLLCERCEKLIEIGTLKELQAKCLKMLNREEFKNARLIRLDDFYYPEVKIKEKIESGYWVKTEVKRDKDKETIIVIYVGHKDSKEKAQFFVKPEKLQLSNDYKDLDPAKVLAQIELTLKDRKITQSYDEAVD